MPLPVREQATYWGVTALAFFLIMWILGDVLLPFILGAALAYCLDPIADRLEAMGFTRLWATITITGLAILVFLLVALLVLPILFKQLEDLIRVAPQLFQSVEAFLKERFPQMFEEGSTLNDNLSGIAATLRERSGELANQILSRALSLLNVLFLVVIVPVITFYLLWDWDHLVERVDSLLPRDHAPVIRTLARQIDGTLASFIRGQGTVCLILGTFYAVALMLAGLDFGLVVGAVAGLITFIPYVGAVVGGALAVGLAFFQFWGDWGWIALIAAIFIAGQFFEGNILTPNLVGQSVGLHPVWLILALTVFGALFGFVGMLVAVPVAASIGVLTRFGVEKYKQSRLYLGLEGRQTKD